MVVIFEIRSDADKVVFFNPRKEVEGGWLWLLLYALTRDVPSPLVLMMEEEEL